MEKKTPDDICPDFPEWPSRWMGVERDLAYGRDLLEAMRPFVEDLIARGLKSRTIRNHMDNLWLLGGEIIRNVSTRHEYDIPPIQKIREMVGPDGGPYCQHLFSEREWVSYDRTCRRLAAFLGHNE